MTSVLFTLGSTVAGSPATRCFEKFKPFINTFQCRRFFTDKTGVTVGSETMGPPPGRERERDYSLSPGLPVLGLSLQSLSSCPAAAPASAAPLAAPSRAAELLSAASAHRAYAECFLAVDPQQSGQQQLLAEMLEGWMTGEDAIEVALPHLPSNHPRSEVDPEVNLINPRAKQGDWTPEEDELILTLVELIGTKWSMIVKHLPGRDANGIKNHFYSNVRRRQRMKHRGERDTLPNFL